MIDSITAQLRASGCVFAEEEAALLMAAAQSPDQLEAMVQQRVGGLPLEHILGWAEFCGLRLIVKPGVFVPRRRTEFLVEQAALRIPPHSTVIDMCCGCGAVGAALLTSKPLRIYASDIDEASVECARANLEPLGGQVFQGDLFTALPPGIQADAIVANVPYVPTESIELMPPEARLYEPRTALNGGSDGLDLFRAVAAEAPKWLRPAGLLFIETSLVQSEAACEALRSNGFGAELITTEDATVVIGQLAN